jgi:hypothetical protein
MDHLWASAFSTCGLMCDRRCYTEGRRRVRTHGLRTELVAVVVGARTGGWGHTRWWWLEGGVVGSDGQLSARMDIWAAAHAACSGGGREWETAGPYTHLGAVHIGVGWWRSVYAYLGMSTQAVGGDGWKGVVVGSRWLIRAPEVLRVGV